MGQTGDSKGINITFPQIPLISKLVRKSDGCIFSFWLSICFWEFSNTKQYSLAWCNFANMETSVLLNTDSKRQNVLSAKPVHKSKHKRMFRHGGFVQWVNSPENQHVKPAIHSKYLLADRTKPLQDPNGSGLSSVGTKNQACWNPTSATRREQGKSPIHRTL